MILFLQGCNKYRMQSKPLGVCLIIDCIGNDAGKCNGNQVAPSCQTLIQYTTFIWAGIQSHIILVCIISHKSMLSKNKQQYTRNILFGGTWEHLVFLLGLDPLLLTDSCQSHWYQIDMEEFCSLALSPEYVDQLISVKVKLMIKGINQGH